MEIVTQTAVLNDIKRVAGRVGTLTRERYRTLGRYASSTVEAKFGSFSNATRRARIKNVATR